MEINEKIFNTSLKDYSNPNILLGETPGLFDTVNKIYPKLWKSYKAMKSLDWDENEFDYSSCNKEFKTCPKEVYDIMIKTLAFQWEADTIAAKSLVNIMSNFITSSEAWAAEQRISDNEIVHAATYSEIVRSSFDNPREVLSEVLAVKESLERLGTVTKVFSDSYTTSHKYALGLVENNQDTYNKAFLCVAAAYIMERIQFMSSFAITFAICDTGLFMPIGKAVQKIAQDELEVHVNYRKALLEYEMKTERGMIAYESNKDIIKAMIDEAIENEINWSKYIFSEGRSLVGMNEDMLIQWSLFCSREVYSFFKVESHHTLPRTNPLKFLEHWLNISKTQASPQEEQNGQYKVGVMRRDDSDEEFEVDF